MHTLINGTLLASKATQSLKEILSRSLDLENRKKDPANQVDGFLGGGLPIGSVGPTPGNSNSKISDV